MHQPFPCAFRREKEKEEKKKKEVEESRWCGRGEKAWN
jgi:hypothetical protein